MVQDSVVLIIGYLAFEHIANHPMTWSHIPEQILQMRHSKNLKTRSKIFVC